MRVTELYAAVAEWACTFGDTDISKQPGLWYRKTQKIGSIGPLDVRINPHKETIDGVPPFNAKISMDAYFPGLIGIIGPCDGMLMRSPVDGEDEAGMIAHFKANTAANQKVEA